MHKKCEPIETIRLKDYNYKKTQEGKKALTNRKKDEWINSRS